MLFAKYAVSALIIVAVSEVAKRSGKAGAFISSLPLVTLIVMTWLYLEGQPRERIAEYAKFTFWYVLPTLPMFLVMPLLLNRGFTFWFSLIVGAAVVLVSFAVMVPVAKLAGVNLLP
jgi:hypothetical protein